MPTSLGGGFGRDGGEPVTTEEKRCFHCGKAFSGTTRFGRIAPVLICDRDGEQRTVPLCDSCSTNRDCWLGWRPVKPPERAAA
jgi:hypothetical protein